MQQPHERLQRARELAGYENATDAAIALGVPAPTYLGHENGSRGFKIKAERYAKFFRVSYEWLMTGAGEPRPASLDARVKAMSPEERRRIYEFIDFVESRSGLKNTG
jgi:hypothetical protein